MTVLEAIQRSTDFLGGKGVESPRLQAELLLAHVLRLKRMQLYLKFERLLTETEVTQYREWIRRRGEREPLQHIVGSTNFCGLELLVNRSVLVPRPETEILAEQGWKLLKHIEPLEAGAPKEAPKALDLGTGSGCIAIALAVHCKAASIVATDISDEAMPIAKKNAEAHGVADRIRFIHGDLFERITAEEKFDLIISNPPYIASTEIAGLDPEVRDFDPRSALDGGPDGLNFYRLIAARARTMLEPGGKCIIEFGDGQSAAVREIFEKEKWIVEAILEDYNQRPRIMIARGE